MSESMTTCPFCKRDPFHYVHNGLGMEAVAVVCCELGDLYFRGARPAPETVTIEWDEFVAIADRLRRTPPAAVPEGWVMVPREPTSEMDAAFLKTLDWMNGPTADQQREAWRQENRRRWALMIAAAPAAPAIETDAPGGQQEAMALIRWAHDTLYEINPSNYDHDEVCRLNDASVEVILAFAQFLGEPPLTDGDDPAPAAPTEGRDE